jgi:hypothetical protein
LVRTSRVFDLELVRDGERRTESSGTAEESADFWVIAALVDSISSSIEWMERPGDDVRRSRTAVLAGRGRKAPALTLDVSFVSTRTFTKFQYWTEFPGSSERGRSSQMLEDTLSWDAGCFTPPGERTRRLDRGRAHPLCAETAVIANRNHGYRWVLGRRDGRVEFRTPVIVEESVGDESIDIHLDVRRRDAHYQGVHKVPARRDGQRDDGVRSWSTVLHRGGVRSRSDSTKHRTNYWFA